MDLDSWSLCLDLATEDKTSCLSSKTSLHLETGAHCILNPREVAWLVTLTPVPRVRWCLKWKWLVLTAARGRAFHYFLSKTAVAFTAVCWWNFRSQLRDFSLKEWDIERVPHSNRGVRALGNKWHRGLSKAAAHNAIGRKASATYWDSVHF